MKDNESSLEFFERKCQTDIRFIKMGAGKYSVTEGAYVRKRRGGRNVKAYGCVQWGGGVKK